MNCFPITKSENTFLLKSQLNRARERERERESHPHSSGGLSHVIQMPSWLRLILRWHLPNEALTADPANTFTAICNHLSRLVPTIFGGWNTSPPASRVAERTQIFLQYLILRLNLPLVTPGMCWCRCGRCGACLQVFIDHLVYEMRACHRHQQQIAS